MGDYRFIEDNDLSLKAKGMMTLLLKHPRASLRDFMQFTGEGRTAISNALNELEGKGYVVSKQAGRGKPERVIFPDGPVQ